MPRRNMIVGHYDFEKGYTLGIETTNIPSTEKHVIDNYAAIECFKILNSSTLVITILERILDCAEGWPDFIVEFSSEHNGMRIFCNDLLSLNSCLVNFSPIMPRL